MPAHNLYNERVPSPNPRHWFVAWRKAAHKLKRQSVALYFAWRDPRTPWYAKGLAALVAAYALSPIDLIPDFIPVLGYLDDLILLPLGIALVLRLIPPAVLADCQAKAEEQIRSGIPRPKFMTVVIIALWVLALAALLLWAARLLGWI